MPRERHRSDRSTEGGRVGCSCTYHMPKSPEPGIEEGENALPERIPSKARLLYRQRSLVGAIDTQQQVARDRWFCKDSVDEEECDGVRDSARAGGGGGGGRPVIIPAFPL